MVYSDHQEPSLLDISNARPTGKVQFPSAGGGKGKGGGGSSGDERPAVDPDYLQKTREEDPWPEEVCWVDGKRDENGVKTKCVTRNLYLCHPFGGELTEESVISQMRVSGIERRSILIVRHI